MGKLSVHGKEGIMNHLTMKTFSDGYDKNDHPLVTTEWRDRDNVLRCWWTRPIACYADVRGLPPVGVQQTLRLVPGWHSTFTVAGYRDREADWTGD